MDIISDHSKKLSGFHHVARQVIGVDLQLARGFGKDSSFDMLIDGHMGAGGSLGRGSHPYHDSSIPWSDPTFKHWTVLDNGTVIVESEDRMHTFSSWNLLNRGSITKFPEDPDATLVRVPRTKVRRRS